MIAKNESRIAVLSVNDVEMRRIEQQLDKLIAQYGSAAADVGRPVQAVLDEIRRKYEAGGWKVKIDRRLGEQMAGVFIELS